ncbi:MoeB/ThiF family adenylyltransferase [Cohnella lubricantis]|uniref:ThiF family adenylyltransferase n=1 Tax=Cohnella lubricantis TaxID=2163172 RepID=A0A841THS3_9BACL|nr:MoeB/ThiF family adenylyltransferase [Cohnella lubricantis]MBB6679449.1 ThiF family adenylyltransferase [Cohnella lubricantis]MBP2118186.1 molybdopterin/thiamine biosynthesis adenylyltransferase [Cohnella lubricantis]
MGTEAKGRYSRQELFGGIGAAGQRKLAKKHVLIVGAGALGTAGAETLVRAGVGTVTIADRDYVDWSNLQRQQLFREEDARQRLPKAIAAKRRLAEVNSEVDVRAVVGDVTAETIESLVEKVDLILDATDNFEARFLINDIAQKRRIPWVYGACVGSYGVSCAFVPGETPCLGCMLSAFPPAGATCDTVGIIAPAVQMVSAYQTSEALKLLVGDHGALRRKLVSFDLWANEHTAFGIDPMRKADCPSCGANPTYPYLQASGGSRTAVLCGRDTVQIRPPAPAKLNLAEAAGRLSRLPEAQVEGSNPYLISCRVGEHRLVIFEDGRVLVHGTKDTAEARSLYHKYIG